MNQSYRNNSGMGKDIEVPQEVKRWNWGIFLLPGVLAILIALLCAFGAIQLFFHPMKNSGTFGNMPNIATQEQNRAFSNYNMSQNNNQFQNLNNQAMDTYKDDEKTVLVSVDSSGRSNPFEPYVEKSLEMKPVKLVNKYPDLPPPPRFDSDNPIAKLMTIKVTGILFDTFKPSAIINVNDSDYLVHKGDKIFDYYVKNITADKVVIKMGNNVYNTGVGEIIYGDIKNNPVKSVDKMFAGNTQSGYLPNIRLN